MAKPTLIIVSGPPGSGKTTLAHAIARAVRCPAICRDEIKEGLVHADGGVRPVWGGPITQRTFDTFFDVVHLLLSSGVTTVAEAAFQHTVWEPKLEPLVDLARIRVLHCTVDPVLARERMERRIASDPARLAAHPDDEFLEELDSGKRSLAAFDPLALDAPRLAVDTTDGYDPTFEEIVAFVSPPATTTG